MKYRVFVTENFTENLAQILRGGQKRIVERLEKVVYPQLREEPHFGPQIKRLRNWEPPTWRYRVGDWRFFYEIDEASRVVFMTAAYHRKEAYRD